MFSRLSNTQLTLLNGGMDLTGREGSCNIVDRRDVPWSHRMDLPWYYGPLACGGNYGL